MPVGNLCACFFKLFEQYFLLPCESGSQFRFELHDIFDQLIFVNTGYAVLVRIDIAVINVFKDTHGFHPFPSQTTYHRQPYKSSVFYDKKGGYLPIAAVWISAFFMRMLYSVLSVFAGAVVSSGAGVGSVSVGSGCVAAGAVAEGSGAVVALSAGVLLGVVGVVGAGSVDGSAGTLLSGVCVLLGCEPVTVITSSL